MDITTLPVSVLSGVASAVVYSFIFYAKKHQDGQEFDINKLIATLIVGAFVGLGLGLSGVEITQENIMQVLVTNVGVIALLESIIKWARRKFMQGNNGSY